MSIYLASYRLALIILAPVVFLVSCNRKTVNESAVILDVNTYVINEGEKQPMSIYVDGKFVNYLIPKGFDRISFKSQAAADSWYNFKWHQPLMKVPPRPGVTYIWHKDDSTYKPASN